MKRALLFFILAIVAIGCFALTTEHPNFVTFTKNTPTTGTIRWSAEPATNVSYYYLSLFPTGTIYTAPSYCDPVWNLPGGDATSFTLDSPGVYKMDVIGLDAGLDYYAYVAAVETSGWSWSAYSSWEPPITLPVELSSFTAAMTAEYFVNLTWVTESETGVLGFNMLRSETENANDALQLNASVIPASNTATTHTYSIVDSQVDNGQTYYYWLQNIDLDGSSDLHGPQSVTLNAPPVPQLPEISTMGNAYPNPFNANNSTNIDLTVKDNETATFTIYNVRGQIMTTQTFSAGVHQFNWSGKNCPNGVYFYKLNTPSTSIVKKMVVIR
jgi:hypothetical protein